VTQLGELETALPLFQPKEQKMRRKSADSKRRKDKGGSAETSNSSAAIRNFVERYENLEEHKVALAEDFKLLTAQVKAEGFDADIIKQLVKIRKNEAKAKEKAQLLATYAAACQLDLFGEQPDESEEREAA
jgi:uncharacterized protein (UPF0335 family)